MSTTMRTPFNTPIPYSGMPSPPSSTDYFPIMDAAANQRLVLVSNRLPVNVKRHPHGGYSFEESSGGLVTGMSGLRREFDMLWYGWPGLEISVEEESNISERLREEHNAVPILLNGAMAQAYYNGFSNTALWPLLHYQPNSIRYRRDEWEAYYKVNQIFANKLANDISDGDIVWIHDYHLMLVPRMLSEAATKLGKRVTIGFFLHTPFPDGDMFRILPVWRDILENMLHCRMIGFHIEAYAQNFARTCGDYLKCQRFPNHIQRYGIPINLGVYPIGIDVPKFRDHMATESMGGLIADMRRSYNVTKLIVGVDRLDYTKGISHKITAMECFLDRNPHLVGQISLVQVVVPSRENIQDYKDLGISLDYRVEAVNRKYGSGDYKPIHLLRQSVPFDQLMTMYAAADVCFVSSLRDGLNLVSFEYVATQSKRKGVLLLSEFAGAAKQLQGSVLFNPWDVDGTVEALHRAVTMELSERSSNQNKSEDYVFHNSSAAWGKSFVTDLKQLSVYNRNWG